MTNHRQERPTRIGYSTPCEIVGVIDGDTILVRVTTDVRVRLLDCWAPEARTTDPEEKQRGVAVREWLREYAFGKRAVLHVPRGGANDLGDVTSLSRVLAEVWVEDDTMSLSDILVAEGRATRTKERP